MVFGVVLLWSLIVLMVGSGCAWGIVALFSVPERAVDDVVDYIVPIDLQKIEDLFDPGTEYSHRMYLRPREFRRFQAKRLHLLMEMLRRISHNAHVLMEFASIQAEQTESVLVGEAACKVRDQALVVKLRARTTLVMLHCWSLSRFRLSSSSRRTIQLSSLRKRHGLPTLATYRQLRSDALNLYSLLRPNSTERLAMYL